MKSLYWKLIAVHGEERAIIRFLRRAGADSSWKILDVGCGYGRNLRFLREAGYRPVGVEIAPQIADEVRNQGFTCLHPDDPSLKSVSWDVILMSHIIEHFEPRELLTVMDDYLDLLGEGGFLLIATPLPHRAFWDNFDHIKPYNPAALEEVFGLRNRQVQFQSRNELALIDLWVRRRPLTLSVFSLRFSAPLLKKPMTIQKIGVGLANITLRLLHSVSFGMIGITDGWVGLYRKVNPSSDSTPGDVF